MANRCDGCDKPLTKGEGGICDQCVQRLHEDRWHDWWDEETA